MIAVAGVSGSGLTVRRGEIWWVDFDPTQGAEIRKRRPAVVITAAIRSRGTPSDR